MFSEEGRLEIAESETLACERYPGLDVISGEFHFFSADGSALEPIFDVPIKEIKVLWMTFFWGKGQYHLEPAPANVDEPLWMIVGETLSMTPNAHFRSLEEAIDHLSSNGAEVQQANT